MEYGIGNTADFGVSELDEGQAAGLLAAVGGHGLSLVEPGPATDPAGAGLAYAIRRAYDCWRETQPQLFWTDENLYGLDDQATEKQAAECPAAARLIVEPERLNSGAEPCRATPWAPVALSAAPSATPNADGSAPSHNNGDGANPGKEARRPQEVTLDVR